MEQTLYSKRLRQTIIAERLSAQHHHMPTTGISEKRDLLIADYTTGFAVREGRKINLIGRRIDDVEQRDVEGLVLDLSDSGLKFRSADKIEIGEVLALEISPSTASAVLECQAEICWSRKDENTAMYGCAFTKEIANQRFNSFLKHLERRGPERINVTANAQLRRIDSPEQMAVRVIDYSEGGLGLKSTSEIEVGEQVILQMDMPEKHPYIAVEVRNCRPSEDKFIVGTQFLPTQDRAVTREFHKAVLESLEEDEDDAQQEVVDNEVRSSVGWRLLVGVGMVEGIAAASLLTLYNWAPSYLSQLAGFYAGHGRELLRQMWASVAQMLS
jgi:hypothetical protein